MKKEFLLDQWLVCLTEGTISCAEGKKRLEPKALSVLLVLAEAAGSVVSREELLNAVWPNQFVGDDVINSNIAALRKALGDDRKRNKYIQTVPKKGYKLVKAIQWVEPDSNHAVPNKPNTTSQIVAPILNLRFFSLIVLVLLTIVLIVIYQPSQESTSVAKQNSIAVLPFEIFSSDPDLNYFADGLAEEMLHQLASNPELKVIARSASFQYRDSTKDLSSIASELEARYLIEGSVREFNGELKITVQLIDAKNNYHLWSRVFDENTSNLFEIQEHVGVAVSNMLSIEEPKTGWNKGRRHSQSDQAYKYFVMAQAHFKVASASSYKEAEVLLNKAIKIAPDYALAYSSKAVAHLLQYQYNRTSLAREVANASAALEKALALEPNQPEAHVAKGLMYTYTGQLEEAEAAYLKALELNPKLRIAHHNFAYMLWTQARYPQAIEHAEFALAADPLAKPTNFLLGDALGRLGYIDRAIEHYQHCQKVLPRYVWCYSGLAEIYRITGDLEQSQIHMERSASLEDTGDYWRGNSHASLLIFLNEFDQASKMLQQVTEKTGASDELLHNRFLIALALNKMPQFSDQVDNFYNEDPENIEIRKFKALSAYQQKDYLLAIELYEGVLEENPATMFELWDYADGISHPINLAVAYDKIGMQKQKQQLLMRIEQHLSSFSERLERIPGGLYVKAQYSALLGNTENSKQLLQQLEQDWALKWLAQKDPFWLGY